MKAVPDQGCRLPGIILGLPALPTVRQVSSLGLRGNPPSAPELSALGLATLTGLPKHMHHHHASVSILKTPPALRIKAELASGANAIACISQTGKLHSHCHSLCNGGMVLAGIHRAPNHGRHQQLLHCCLDRRPAVTSTLPMILLKSTSLQVSGRQACRSDRQRLLLGQSKENNGLPAVREKSYGQQTSNQTQSCSSHSLLSSSSRALEFTASFAACGM